jgi:hypothetical protein
LKAQSNPILTAVCTKGMKDPNPEIKKVACKALCNSLSFASSNMENQVFIYCESVVLLMMMRVLHV